MGQTIEEQLKDILVDLRENVEGIKGSLVASLDGLVIACDFEEGTNIDIISAMSAMIHGAVNRAAKGLKLREMETILVMTKDASIAMCSVGSEVSFLALFEKEVNLLSALKEMKKEANRIANVLGLEKA